MYVCACRGVTDRTIETVIATGACTIEDVARRCAAGARCGGCWPEIKRLLAQHLDREARRDTRVAV